GRPRSGVAARGGGADGEEGDAGLGPPADGAARPRRRRAHPRPRRQSLPQRNAPRSRQPRADHAGAPAPSTRGATLRGGCRGRGRIRRAQSSRRPGGAQRVPGRGGRGATARPGGRRRPVKGFGNIMKEAQKLQAQMEQLQTEVAKKKVEATAGGGMVTVEANGKQEILSIK